MAGRGRPPKGEGKRSVVHAYMQETTKLSLHELGRAYGFSELSPFVEEIVKGVLAGTIDIDSVRQPHLDLDLEGKGLRRAS